MATFLCKTCKKKRQVHSSAPNSNTCIRCKFVANRVILLKVFDTIMGQPDMKLFIAELKEWYPSEPG